MNTPQSFGARGVPESFLDRFGGQVAAILSGFDRIRFRATLRVLFVPAMMEAYLRACRVLLKDFKGFALNVSGRIKAAAYASAKAAGRPGSLSAQPGNPGRPRSRR